MEYRVLGNTGIRVSRLCFGGLVMGPLQRNLTIDEGAVLLAAAYGMGINFVDTAELYGTYAHVRKSMEISNFRPVIATKSYAYNRDGAKYSVEKALNELGVDTIDLFLMHEQESAHTIRGHWDALSYYLELKDAGVIKAVGISTHHIAGVLAAVEVPEIDVIHPITNMSGLGICDGTMDQMLEAIQKAHHAGKGIYGMKPLGGGNLLHSYEACMKFALDIPWLDSLAIGMQNPEELTMNVLIAEGGTLPPNIAEVLSQSKKALHVDFWCEGCGKCEDRCQQQAISVREGKAVPHPDRCVLCGYCAAVCPAFALKVY